MSVPKRTGKATKCDQQISYHLISYSTYWKRQMSTGYEERGGGVFATRNIVYRPFYKANERGWRCRSRADQ